VVQRSIDCRQRNYVVADRTIRLISLPSKCISFVTFHWLKVGSWLFMCSQSLSKRSFNRFNIIDENVDRPLWAMPLGELAKGFRDLRWVGVRSDSLLWRGWPRWLVLENQFQMVHVGQLLLVIVRKLVVNVWRSPVTTLHHVVFCMDCDLLSNELLELRFVLKMVGACVVYVFPWWNLCSIVRLGFVIIILFGLSDLLWMHLGNQIWDIEILYNMGHASPPRCRICLWLHAPIH